METRAIANKIAIIGMSCLFPKSPDLTSYWTNIVSGVDCTREVTEEEWDPKRYLDPQSTWLDRIYCRRGGFITELAEFDPLKYGVMPKSVEGSDPDQLLALRLAVEALADAGYDSRAQIFDHGEIMLGRTSAPGAGSLNLIQHVETIHQVLNIIKSLNPQYGEEQLKSIGEALRASLNQCNSDTIPAVMPNVIAGRIAGRLGFKGRSLILDAACASSLVAVEIAVDDLLSGKCDLALAGGIHINSFASFYAMFCGLGALSHSQQIRPFDDEADGTLLGEGIGMVVLKRLVDAISTGDRIYAVISGVGSSSDGTGTSMLAPSSQGEANALIKAYEMAGISPTTISLIEAHGTGTPSGDVKEMQAIAHVFNSARDKESEKSAELWTSQKSPWCALGSVKSMIGHCQAASGIAGLIKTALALYHRILPPTLGVSKPNSRINWSESPCYINSRSRVWIHPKAHPTVLAELPALEPLAPRRAGVSAFGFGGINAHAILEEYDDIQESHRSSLLLKHDSEVCLFQGEDWNEVEDMLDSVAVYIQSHPDCYLKDVAYTLSSAASEVRSNKARPPRVCIVASSIADLLLKVELVKSNLKQQSYRVSQTPPGNNDIYFGNEINHGKLAFLLPGLGAAYPNMLSELCIHYPDVRYVFDFVDLLSLTQGLQGSLKDPPSKRIFPISSPSHPSPAETAASLASMDSAVVTVLLAEWSLFTLLKNLAIYPDVVAGCSTGEFAALCISGAVNIIAAAPLFYRLSTNIARSIPEDGLVDLQTIKIQAHYHSVKPIIKKLKKLGSDLYLSADLSPTQVLISGSRTAVDLLIKELRLLRIEYHPLPTAVPYHTPLVKNVVDPENSELTGLPLNTPSLPVWSCSLGSTYPSDHSSIRRIVTELFGYPILFRETVEAMYADGVTKFVEVGPKGSLTPLVSEILAGRPHLSVASNYSYGSSLTQFNHLLAALICQYVPVHLTYMYQRRSPVKLDFDKSSDSDTKLKNTVKLSTSYPEISLSKEYVLQLTGAEAKVTAPQESNLDTINSTEEEVIRTYLKNMASFHHNLMSVQQEVISAYLDCANDYESGNHTDLDGSIEKDTQLNQRPETRISAARSGALRIDSEEPRDESYQLKTLPCLSRGQIHSVPISNSDAQTISIDLTLTLNHDLYLLDHAIGDFVIVHGDNAEKVYLLPLMVALEMMAETASLLMPGLKPVRLENIKAQKRIRVTSSGFPIRITANSVDGQRTCVSIKHRDNKNAKGHLEEPLASADILFSDKYPKAPVKKRPLISDGRSANSKALYGEGRMFHGPRLQAVTRIDQVGASEITGCVRVKPIDDWFHSEPAARAQTQKPTMTTLGSNVSRFLIDPCLMDNSTQFVLFHLFEHDLKAHALLPFLIDSIDLFSSLTDLNEELFVHAKLSSISKRVTVANIDLMGKNDQLLARFESITSRRIILDERWANIVSQPLTARLGTECPQYLESLPQPQLWSCVEITEEELPEDETTLAWCLDYVLSTNEQDYYQRELRDLRRRHNWLLGRLAAKQAVRDLLLRLKGVHACLADIEIQTEKDGRPKVAGACIQNLGWTPLLSISHKDGYAICLTASLQAAQSVGIDVEEVIARDTDFVELTLTSKELLQFDSVTDDQRDLTITQFWSAKEALGKALGIGLGTSPKNTEVMLEKPGSHFTIGYGTAGKVTESAKHKILCCGQSNRVIAVAVVGSA